MPLLILGVVVFLMFVGFVFVSANKERFVREKPFSDEDKERATDIIYLPADLEEEKTKSSEAEEEL